jgi:hypothetical protein
MAAMPSMHEEVHAAADEQERRQRPQTEQMCPMLEQDEQGGDRKEAAQNQADRRAPERGFFNVSGVHGKTPA